jgi:hypothetical protein
MLFEPGETPPPLREREGLRAFPFLVEKKAMNFILKLGNQVWCGKQHGWHNLDKAPEMRKHMQRFVSKGMAKRIAVQHGFGPAKVEEIDAK